jgi:hypothetical protein
MHQQNQLVQTQVPPRALGLAGMNRSTGFLLELASSLEQRLSQWASVHSRVDGSYCELTVTPIRDDACGLTIHSEEDTEMTIQIGR